MFGHTEKTYHEHIKRVLQAFMENDDFSELFKAREHELFLMHLIHHICSLHCTATNVSVGENDGTAIYSIVGGFFSHSCKPNVILITSDRSTVAVTIRPIEQGEEVTISYLLDELDRSSKYRKKCLLGRYEFQCKCQRCASSTSVSYNSKTALTQQSKNELRNVSHHDPKKQAKRRNLTQICVKYLKVNGRENWNDGCYDGSVMQLQLQTMYRVNGSNLVRSILLMMCR